MNALFFFVVAVAAVATLGALVGPRPTVTLPCAATAAAVWAVAGGWLAAQAAVVPAVVCAVGTGGATLLALTDTEWFRHGRRPVRRTPGPCPDWCEGEHPPPGLAQVAIPHSRVIDSRDLLDGGLIEVRLSWSERLDFRPPRPPVIELSALRRDHDMSTTMPPDEAGFLAMVMAAEVGGFMEHSFSLAVADDAGWLPRVLAEAAQRLGYTEPSRDGAS